MANKNIAMYKLKKTISMKKFISEYGNNFSTHFKERLLELEVRSVLTRKDKPNILEIKHVEHTRYKNNETGFSKELSFGKLTALEDGLYYSNNSDESDTVAKCYKVDELYASLKTSNTILNLELVGKKIDDANIDFFMDGMLNIIPEVSKEYTQIIKEMMKYDK